MSSKEPGMKSAYELAMDRLNRESTARAPVSAEQKARLAEVDRNLKARVAELEIMTEGQLAGARGKGDLDGIETIRTDKAARIRKFNGEAEEERRRIRGGV